MGRAGGEVVAATTEGCLFGGGVGVSAAPRLTLVAEVTAEMAGALAAAPLPQMALVPEAGDGADEAETTGVPPLRTAAAALGAEKLLKGTSGV